MAKRARKKEAARRARRRPPPPPPKFYGLGNKAFYIIVIVVIVAIGAIAAHSLLGDGDGNGEVNPAPTFTVKDVYGNTVRLTSLRGKVVVLDLFAIQCPPCRDQIGELKVIDAQYSDSKVVIISIDVNTQETVEDVRAFKEDYGAGWAFAMDTDNVGPKYNVQYIPTLVLIDQDGNLVWTHSGLTSASKLEGLIDPLL